MHFLRDGMRDQIMTPERPEYEKRLQEVSMRGWYSGIRAFSNWFEFDDFVSITRPEYDKLREGFLTGWIERDLGNLI